MGGKRLLRESIIAKIPSHRCYVEAFAGAAWVYWGKPPSEIEVINDIDGNLVNLYRQIQTNVEAFYEKVWYLLVSREEYHRYLKLLTKHPESLSDLERAVYYFYIIKHTFGGRFGAGFAFSKTHPPKSTVGHDTLLALSERLQNTYVDNLSYERILKNYDGKDTFFYCDPPYVVANDRSFYRYYFNEQHHIELQEKLSKIEGKFLLSYDDVPLIRELYKDFAIEQTDPVQYSLSKKRQVKKELLIRNY